MINFLKILYNRVIFFYPYLSCGPWKQGSFLEKSWKFIMTQEEEACRLGELMASSIVVFLVMIRRVDGQQYSGLFLVWLGQLMASSIVVCSGYD